MVPLDEPLDEPLQFGSAVPPDDDPLIAVGGIDSPPPEPDEGTDVRGSEFDVPELSILPPHAAAAISGTIPQTLLLMSRVLHDVRHGRTVRISEFIAPSMCHACATDQAV